jgi:hypothetical protein
MGFTFQQLDHLIRDKDDPTHPLTPSKQTVLVISKTLYDGLNAIDTLHRDFHRVTLTPLRLRWCLRKRRYFSMLVSYHNFGFA